MEKNEPVDYMQAARDFEKWKDADPGILSGFDFPMEPGAGVNYQEVSDAYQQYLDLDASERIHNEGEK